MAATGIVEAVDVLEDGCLCWPPGWPTVPPDHFRLQGFEEGLDSGVVVAIALAAHRWTQARMPTFGLHIPEASAWPGKRTRSGSYGCLTLEGSADPILSEWRTRRVICPSARLERLMKMDTQAASRGHNASLPISLCGGAMPVQPSDEAYRSSCRPTEPRRGRGWQQTERRFRERERLLLRLA